MIIARHIKTFFPGRFPVISIQIPINSSSDQSQMDFAVGTAVWADEEEGCLERNLVSFPIAAIMQPELHP
jgi:hypothetical protein